jgi:hypothetical protein
MGQHKTITAGMVLGALASGALAVGALGQAGPANATCLSVSGLTIGKGCTSTFGDMAVAIGNSATASATGGLFGTAFALGTSAEVETDKVVFGAAFALGTDAEAHAAGTLTHVGILDTAFALGTGAEGAALDGSLNGAVALGPSAFSEALGNANTSFAAGDKASALTGGIGNYASAVGNPGPNANDGGATVSTTAEADGVFTRAVAIGNGDFANAESSLITPLKLGNNTALVVGSGSTATVNFPIGTKKNTVAVAIGKNKTTTK